MAARLLRIAAAVSLAILLAGCSKPDIASVDSGITAQNYPKIDGSTSALPIIQQLYKEFHLPDEGTADTWRGMPAEAVKTDPAYHQVISGVIDIAIVPEPTQDALDFAQERGVELEYHPICSEALVFIVNSATDVKDITTEQLRQIYVDATLTKWSELGGNDTQIFALYRNFESGSHALFDKFVLQGSPLHQQIEHNIAMATMISIIDPIEEYTAKSAGSTQEPLAFTLYYYLQHNKTANGWDNVDMLSIAGIEPSAETISNGKYPYSTNYNAVIRSDTPADSPARKLIEWLTASAQGEKLIETAGFGI